MNLVPLSPQQAFTLTGEQKNSFTGHPKAYRISGPPGLVRLVQNGRGKTGAFWFGESVFTRLRETAKRDLTAQTRGQVQPFGGATMREMVGLYMKFCLRSDLAICKNWTESFDSYVVLPLRPMDTVVAWAGPIKKQPYFSEPTNTKEKGYAEKKAAYDLAEKGGVSLLAGEQQYIIDFTYPANRGLESRLLGPFPF